MEQLYRDGPRKFSPKTNYNLNTSDIKGAQPKKVSDVVKGLKRRNFFDDGQIENLHLKDKYGRKNVSSNIITHEKEINNNFGSYATAEVNRSIYGPQGYRKNVGNTFAPPNPDDKV